MISHVLVARHPPQMSINDTTQVMAGYKLHEESASPVGNRLAGSFYFFYYAAMAALSPFLVLHYEQLGLDGRQIGLLAGIPPALILLGATGWGALADASQQHRAVLAVAIAGTIVAVAALSVAQTFSWLIAIVIFMALMQSPITPLVDNSVLHALGEHRDRYGRIRIWGAIGWGACGPIAGHLVERFGLSASFSTYLALFAICFSSLCFCPLPTSVFLPSGRVCGRW
jgi:PPP family 3-phenylpropionic acid transporter